MYFILVTDKQNNNIDKFLKLRLLKYEHSIYRINSTSAIEHLLSFESYLSYYIHLPFSTQFWNRPIMLVSIIQNHLNYSIPGFHLYYSYCSNS